MIAAQAPTGVVIHVDERAALAGALDIKTRLMLKFKFKLRATHYRPGDAVGPAQVFTEIDQHRPAD